ncbi:tetratricopeptide repeat protein [Acetobacter sacchari]|uniref:protein O-GlcNAc transferase n=1 Tax=Acetobacter sacchari TaxID=2661687 RepID=A0ABS3LXB2_9PROT|nr:tetratricopeptide repeat protein [Acetobacter sacchari]
MISNKLKKADALQTSGKYGSAIKAYKIILKDYPDNFDVLNGLGYALYSLEYFSEAVIAFRKALKIRSNTHSSRLNLARSLYLLGHVREASAEYEYLISFGDEDNKLKALNNLAVIAPGNIGYDNERVLEIRRRWAESQAPQIIPRRVFNNSNERLRLAYYGSYFSNKNWMKMYMGVINAHNRSRFDVNIIADGPPPDFQNGYVDHENDRIWGVESLSNAELSNLIFEEKIDILVDLNGYSHQRRLPLLNYRSAPVQLVWNGMYATTGFPNVDGIIGDNQAIRSNEQEFYTEKFIRLDGTYLPFDFFYDTTPVTNSPCLGNGYITFGSLNSSYKITEETIEFWASIMMSVTGSRMVVRTKTLDKECNRKEIIHRFTKHGIDQNRISLFGSGSHESYLKTYEQIDIALDTLPYSGGTTTVEALWQGVPVLTVPGDRWASRTSASILSAAGFVDFIATNQEDAILRVRSAASDYTELNNARINRRIKLKNSNACATQKICNELEHIYADKFAALRLDSESFL